MKKILITLLVVINIFVLIGLAGLVFYQFKQILDRNNQIDALGSQLVQIKNAKNTPKVGQSSALTQSSLQIKDEIQSGLFDNLKKNSENQATVKIYFSKKNENVPTIISVDRLTERKDVLTFVIEELVNGPTNVEQTQGIYSSLKLSGPSNCGTSDFNLSVNSDKVTVKFCKSLIAGSSAENSNIKENIESTLKQFSGFQKIVILNNNSTCFGDTSGQDLCKSI